VGQSGDGGEGNDPETHAIIGVPIEVHRQLGSGFLEAVYQEALAVEFKERRLSFQREADLPVRYKGRALNCSYRADFVCFDSVIVELRALSELTGREHAQVLN
jgi:GxxExxY protein